MWSQRSNSRRVTVCVLNRKWTSWSNREADWTSLTTAQSMEVESQMICSDLEWRQTNVHVRQRGTPTSQHHTREENSRVKQLRLDDVRQPHVMNTTGDLRWQRLLTTLHINVCDDYRYYDGTLSESGHNRSTNIRRKTKRREAGAEASPTLILLYFESWIFISMLEYVLPRYTRILLLIHCKIIIFRVVGEESDHSEAVLHPGQLTRELTWLTDWPTTIKIKKKIKNSFKLFPELSFLFLNCAAVTQRSNHCYPQGHWLWRTRWESPQTPGWAPRRRGQKMWGHFKMNTENSTLLYCSFCCCYIFIDTFIYTYYFIILLSLFYF